MLLICAATILIGFPVPHLPEDDNALKTATKGCSTYYPKEPCLIKMTKTEEHVYRATCGVPKST